MDEKIIADALRELVVAIYNDCYGDDGAGDIGYTGEYKQEIEKLAKILSMR